MMTKVRNPFFGMSVCFCLGFSKPLEKHPVAPFMSHIVSFRNTFRNQGSWPTKQNEVHFTIRSVIGRLYINISLNLPNSLCFKKMTAVLTQVVFHQIPRKSWWNIDENSLDVVEVCTYIHIIEGKHLNFENHVHLYSQLDPRHLCSPHMCPKASH